MKDPEIVRRLRGFDTVWARVRGAREETPPRDAGAVLMPRRQKKPCRPRCRRR